MQRALRLKLAETWHHTFGLCVTEAVCKSFESVHNFSVTHLPSHKQIWECVPYRHRKYKVISDQGATQEKSFW
jgi:hypothetical protein